MNNIFLVNRNTKVFLFNSHISMACGFPKLTKYIEASGIQNYKLALGNLYLFLNKKCTYIKILFVAKGGLCILSKKLDKGKFFINLDNATIKASELDTLINKNPLKLK